MVASPGAAERERIQPGVWHRRGEPYAELSQVGRGDRLRSPRRLYGSNQCEVAFGPVVSWWLSRGWDSSWPVRGRAGARGAIWTAQSPMAWIRVPRPLLTPALTGLRKIPRQRPSTHKTMQITGPALHVAARRITMGFTALQTFQAVPATPLTHVSCLLVFIRSAVQAPGRAWSESFGAAAMRSETGAAFSRVATAYAPRHARTRQGSVTGVPTETAAALVARFGNCCGLHSSVSW